MAGQANAGSSFISKLRYEAIKYACKITFRQIFVDLDTFLIDFCSYLCFTSLVPHNCCIDFKARGKLSVHRENYGEASLFVMETQKLYLSETIPKYRSKTLSCTIS